ncbi:MAG: sulfotransferase [Woeseiaceae bacterium]|nr:sulfotransferase [Woeseiaceae bacterium]
MIRLVARGYTALFTYAFTTSFTDGRRVFAAIGLLLALPPFLAWQLLHWLGFLLDEVFFRGYRNVEVREPLFVLGPPRSGTTHLHRVLALDESTTTFSTWECLFGLSVTGRRLLLALAKVDRVLGRPLTRLASWLGRKTLSSMDEIHELRMDAPEEDFLCLMPAAACFLLIVPFPYLEHLWRVAHFDVAVDEKDKRALMRYYRRCIQKHLYVFGEGKRYLAKNPSFSGMAESLLEAFPDARIIACTRDPVATIPSQLSSLRPGLAACGFREFPADLRDRLIATLYFYYEHLREAAAQEPSRMTFIGNDELKNDLQNAIETAFEHIGIEVSSAFAERLGQAAVESREFLSGHRYSLDEYGLDEAELRERFAGVMPG